MYAQRKAKLGSRLVGDGEPYFVIAEIGINHNGSIDLARQMIEGAAAAGADAVKFQKRTPELCVPKDQWFIERESPWGRISYIDYRYKVEFGLEQYAEIDRYCKERNIAWTASSWDEPSVDFLEQFDVPFHKAPSAVLTNIPLLKKIKSTGKPLIISTGMSTMEEIDNAVMETGTDNLLIAHSTSTYPCRIEELNLRVIPSLRDRFPTVPIGYSGHETGLTPSWAAAVLGASFIERHITLDRAMWGTDQAASVEIGGFTRLVQNLKDIYLALGDGVKKVYDSELPIRTKLRKTEENVSLKR